MLKINKIHDFFTKYPSRFYFTGTSDIKKQRNTKRNKKIKHTNKQATKQINKTTNKQKKHPAMSPSFFLV